jgi:hypothetical protein
LEIAVAAHKRSADGEGGCSYPEVVLIKRKTAALLGQFYTCVKIASPWRDGFTRQRVQQLLSFRFEVGAASSLGQPPQPEQDLATGDCAGYQPIVGSNRRKP